MDGNHSGTMVFYEHVRIWDGPTLVLSYRGQTGHLKMKFHFNTSNESLVVDLTLFIHIFFFYIS